MMILLCIIIGLIIIWFSIVIVSETHTKICRQRYINNSNNNVIEVTRNPNHFQSTKYQVSSYGLDPTFDLFIQNSNSKHLLFLYNLDEKNVINYSPLLRRDRLHLKISHKEKIGKLVHEVLGSICTLCRKKLYLYGFFAFEYYFCFGCIKTVIIPIFVTERLLLCKEILSKYNVPDQLARITMFLSSQCFDINLIVNFKFRCFNSLSKGTGPTTIFKKCTIFQCDKCPSRTEFKPLDVYRYLLQLKPNDSQLLKKIEEEEEEEEKNEYNNKY